MACPTLLPSLVGKIRSAANASGPDENSTLLHDIAAVGKAVDSFYQANTEY